MTPTSGRAIKRKTKHAHTKKPIHYLTLCLFSFFIFLLDVSVFKRKNQWNLYIVNILILVVKFEKKTHFDTHKTSIEPFLFWLFLGSCFLCVFFLNFHFAKLTVELIYLDSFISPVCCLSTGIGVQYSAEGNKTAPVVADYNQPKKSFIVHSH